MRPKVRDFSKAEKISDYPMTPAFESGHLVTINAGWRTFKPELNKEACIGCMRCYLVCPDGVISMTEDNKVDFDYDYCKGCGVCAFECPKDAIEMKKEDK